MRKKNPVYYNSYLQLENILNAQSPVSRSHDEHLFIVVHQVYELWFKQIAWEFSSIIDIFKSSPVSEKMLSKVAARLERIQNIQKLFPDQFEVLETMTPMNFLEFRDLLVPASGFQSVQFRKVEILMGLKMKNRTDVDSNSFVGGMREEDKKALRELEKKPSLFDRVEQWLERMPFAKIEGFDFWEQYDKTIQERYAELVKKGECRLSSKAFLNALFIMLFQEWPILAWPSRVLHGLIGIDEHFTAWRYRHSLMAHRMLGTKIGTGGSSGHQYLKMTADNHRVFKDLFNLSTFLIPEDSLPEIPPKIKKEMGFVFESKQTRSL